MPVVLLTEINVQPFCIAPQYVFIPTLDRVTNVTSTIYNMSSAWKKQFRWVVYLVWSVNTCPVILTEIDRTTSERRTEYR